MCDDRTDAENERDLRRRGLNPSRRALGMMSLAALAACATSSDGAPRIDEDDVSIPTYDGTCDAYFARPANQITAGILVWPDIYGLRPAFRTMGKRLAEAGYAVLTVNQYYRDTRAPLVAEGVETDRAALRERLSPMIAKLTPAVRTADAMMFIDWLDGQLNVDPRRKMGVTGYCMGGDFVFRTAAARAARVGAAASFHGGGLVTDSPVSPHQLISAMTAGSLIAIAQNDDASAPEDKDVLAAAFERAELEAEIEVYPANHGWCVIDSPSYDHDQAERAWANMLALFEKQLS